MAEQVRSPVAIASTAAGLEQARVRAETSSSEIATHADIAPVTTGSPEAPQGSAEAMRVSEDLHVAGCHATSRVKDPPKSVCKVQELASL